MKNFAKSSNGFVNLTFVFILMTFVSLYLTATFAIALSQQRDYVRSTCIQEATDHQIDHLKNVRMLFRLNRQSTILRKGIFGTKALIAAATLAGRVETAYALQKILDGLLQAQKALDVVQKGIINKARIELKVKHVGLIAKINSGQRETASPWRYMISMSSYFNPRSTPTLPIRSDAEAGVGPNYEWDTNAESRLKLAYIWNMSFATSDEYQRFFTWVNVLSLQCSVAPDLRGEKWLLTINADK